MSDKDADEVEQNMNWNAIAEGLKPHEDIHGVVVYGVPKDIDITDPQIIESLKEANHCIKPDAIDRITPLRVETKSNRGRIPLHHRIQQVS